MVTRYGTAALGAIALATLAAWPTAARAYFDTGYRTVMWTQVESDGAVAFRLNESDEVYYRCPPSRAALCNAMLLTAISTQREVKVFYGNSSDSGHSPSPGATYNIQSLRFR